MRLSPALPPLRRTAALGGGSWSPGSLTNLVQWFLDEPIAPYYESLINGMPVLTPQETGTVAQPRAGRCWTFDGVNDSATRGARLTTGSSTVLFWAGWIKATASSGATFSSEYDSRISSRGWACGIFNDGGLATAGKFTVWLSADGGATNFKAYSSATSVNTGSWVHVAFGFSAGVLKLYINGIEDSVTKHVDGTVASIFNASADFLISGLNGASAYVLTGSIKDVLVEQAAWSDAEVLSLYNTHQVPSGKTPLAFYRCEEESGTTGYNSISNANHLTLTNITQATFHAADTGVKYSHCNAKGYTLSGSVVIPASLLTPTQDAAGGALGVTGPVCYPATVDVPCVTGDGSAAYAVSGSNIGISGAANRTVCFRAKLTATGDQNFVGWGATGTDGLMFYVGVLGSNLHVNGWGAADWNTGIVTDTNWHNHAVTYDGTNLRWYVDGTLVASTTRTFNTTNSAVTLLRRSDGAMYSSSRLSDVRIYSDVKTLSEIQAIGSGTDNRTNLVTHWPCQEGAGTSNTNRTIYDTVGTNNLTLNNGTVSTIWTNRCPYAQDWSINYGGSYNPNLLSYTEAFDNGAWTKLQCSVSANAGVDPIGGNTADRITLSGVGGNAYQGYTATGQYCFSVYVKKGSQGNRVSIYQTGSPFAGRYDFNFDAPTGNYTSEGNGWYRIWFTSNLTPNSISVGGYGGGPNASGDNFLVWGAQFEAGSTPTPYKANATTPNGAFIPGRIGSNLDAAGNAKTLSDGKFGNPYSRLSRNRWAAPALVNIGIAANDAVAPSTNVQAASVVDTQFRRSKTDGSDRYFATTTALTGTDKTNAESYVG